MWVPHVLDISDAYDRMQHLCWTLVKREYFHRGKKKKNKREILRSDSDPWLYDTKSINRVMFYYYIWKWSWSHSLPRWRFHTISLRSEQMNAVRGGVGALAWRLAVMCTRQINSSTRNKRIQIGSGSLGGRSILLQRLATSHTMWTELSSRCVATKTAETIRWLAACIVS